MKDLEQKAKALLRNYKPLLSRIEIEINSNPEYTIPSTSFVKTFGNTNNFNSDVENQIVIRDEYDQELQKKIRIANIINAAIHRLTKKQQKIVKERYFENKSYQKIGYMVQLHQETVSKKIKENIIPELINVGILNAWEIFIKYYEESEYYQGRAQ